LFVVVVVVVVVVAASSVSSSGDVVPPVMVAFLAVAFKAGHVFSSASKWRFIRTRREKFFFFA
jgi:hypothetical protein